MPKTTRVPPARTLARSLAGVALLAAGWTMPVAAQVRTEAIVTVLDAAGRPVLDVAPEAFAVREDGRTREVLAVTAAPPPSHLVLLVDDSQATEGLTTDLRLGLASFIDWVASASPTPAMRLATFGGRTTTRLDFTTSPSLLVSGVERIFPQAGNGATFLEAVRESARALASQGATRAAIVAFVAEAGPEFSEDTHQRIAAVLRETGVSLWTVALQDRLGRIEAPAVRERAIVLGDVASDSGGATRPVLSREGIGPAFDAIAEALTSSYAVVYARPDTLIPPSTREVTVAGDDLEVVSTTWASP